MNSLLRPLTICIITCTIGLCAPGKIFCWSPGSDFPEAADGLAVNTAVRNDVVAFYYCMFEASEDFANTIGWTGDLPGDVTGSTSATFRDDVRRRINYYRAMAGLPADITEDAAKTAAAQDYAFLMALNDSAVYPPGPAWDGLAGRDTSAGPDSIRLIGTYGPRAIDFYMLADGQSSAASRRRILYSRLAEIGTGDIPFVPGYNATNCLYIIDPDSEPSSPPMQFVAWPNPGFIPYQVTPRVWSLSYPGADFSTATVSVSVEGFAITPIDILSNAGGAGDNSLVWELPEIMPGGLPNLPADDWEDDVTYDVVISGIVGAPQATCSYSTTVIDPAHLQGTKAGITGETIIPPNGSDYDLEPVDQAEEYEIKVSRVGFTGEAVEDPWAEGAEDTTAGSLIESTPGRSTARIVPTAATVGSPVEGSKVFHFAFPDAVNIEQIIELDRDLIPSGSVTFSQYRGYATSATRLSLEISRNSGLTWEEIWGRSGDTGEPKETGWTEETVSLSAIATNPPRTVRLRFRLHLLTNSLYADDAEDYGFLVDNIQAPNSYTANPLNTNPLAGGSTGFTFDNSMTGAGGALLADGTENGYYFLLQARARLGCQWLGPGPFQIALVETPPEGTFWRWIMDNYPRLTGGPNIDSDGDGDTDGAEFAYSNLDGSGQWFDPTNPESSIPRPLPVTTTWTPGGLELQITAPADRAGVLYRGEYTTHFMSWTPLTNQEAEPLYRFVLPDDLDQAFLRLNPVIQTIPLSFPQ